MDSSFLKIPSLRQLLGSVAKALLLGYLFLLLVGEFASDALIFHPPEPSYALEEPYRLMERPDGGSLAVRFYEAPGSRSLLLYSHGNAEDIGQADMVYDLYRREGFSVLAYDYSGYGHSTGRATEAATYGDIRAVYRYALEVLGREPGDIILFGKSVGGGPSVDLAASEPVGGLILESAFTSVYDVAFPWPVFPGSPFPNLKKLPRVACPVMVIHGLKDTVIPPEHGRRLYAAAPEPKHHHWVEEAHHNDLILVVGREYWEALGAFRDSVEDQ